MKKIVSALLLLSLLVSCKDKTAYTITGSAEGLENGAKVFLYEDRRAQNVLEETTLENGKFSFTGKVQEPVLRFIDVEGRDGRPIHVVIEPGDITLNIGETESVSGTPLNEKNYSFWSSLGEKSAPDSKLVFDFIKQNTDNVLGVYYANQNAYMFDLAQLKEIVSLFPAEWTNNEMLNQIKELVSNQEETAVGKKFKDLKGLTPAGEEKALSDYVGKGKVVLVDFWASWCPPCRQDMPYLVNAYARYKDKGFEIVGVSLDKTNEDWKQGIEDLGITWPQISDLKYWGSELSKAYGVRSIPFTVLIDKEGNIVDQKISGKDLDAKLSELLAK